MAPEPAGVHDFCLKPHPLTLLSPDALGAQADASKQAEPASCIPVCNRIFSHVIETKSHLYGIIAADNSDYIIGATQRYRQM
jgi:hypothetical protein